MRRLLNFPGITFLLFVIWKMALFLATVQPIPSNDAFFYDGAVVNVVNGGGFINPAVAVARPYSGTEFFSAYPLLYQFTLLGWMKVFGASVVAAIAFHVVLVTLWAGVVYCTLRRLAVPAWLMHVGGGILFGLTFHDRPDTLGHLFGAVAMFFAVDRIAKGKSGSAGWAALIWLLLTFAVSLQLGAAYTGIIGVTLLAFAWATKTPAPWTALVTMGVLPAALLVAAKFGFPAWWIGFMENAQNNPSSPGLHLPTIEAVLKLVRTLPGALLILGFAVLAMVRRSGSAAEGAKLPIAVFVGTSFGVISICALGLCALTANYIPSFATNLQPLMVVAGAMVLVSGERPVFSRWLFVLPLCLALVITSVRAVGMSTWGVWCGRDVGYRESRTKILDTLSTVAPRDRQRPAVLSAAYLYDAYGKTQLRLIHSDYLVLLEGRATKSDLQGLLALQPSCIILTQFDYYRRYESTISQLRRERGDVVVRISNTARVQSPDAIPSMRKVVQHISWAPVIIEIDWPVAAARP